MAPLNVEFTKIVAAPAYLADASVAKPAFEVLKNISGVRDVYHGLSIQEPNCAYIVTVWESLAHHNAFYEDKASFGTMQTHLQGIVAKELLYVKDVTFTHDPFSSLNAPITEIALWTAKDGADYKLLGEKIDKLVQAVFDQLSSGAEIGSGRGIVEQSEKELLNLFGWESLEAWDQALKSHPEFGPFIDEALELATLDLKHVALSKY